MKYLISLIIFCLAFVAVSFSQRVIPSDRVETWVNIRITNDAGADAIDSLFPGESVAYIESVSYWHKVRCDDGAEGYVSKAWTKIDDGSSPVEGKTDLVIASWNMKFFASESKTDIDYAAFADYFEKFDVLAIQELSTTATKAHLDAFKEELNSRGYKYEFIVGAKTGYTKYNPDDNKGKYTERLGFLWDMDRVDLIESDSAYEFMLLPVKDNPVFRQVPIIATFKTKSENGFDFKVVSVHAAFNDAIPYVRQAEFHYLDDWMTEQKNSTEKDIFIMGDFNSNPKNKPTQHYFDTIIGNTTAYRVVFNEPVLAGEDPIKTTILIPTTDNPSDHQIPVYDHLLLSFHAATGLPDTLTWASGLIGVIQFDQDQRWQDTGYSNTWKAISDHRPIWIKIPYDTEDRD